MANLNLNTSHLTAMFAKDPNVNNTIQMAMVVVNNSSLPRRYGNDFKSVICEFVLQIDILSTFSVTAH